MGILEWAYGQVSIPFAESSHMVPQYPSSHSQTPHEKFPLLLHRSLETTYKKKKNIRITFEKEKKESYI